MASNESEKVMLTALATTAFSHPPANEVNSHTSIRKVKKRVGKKASLELTRSRDIRPVHEIAAQGSLEELKELIETFGVSIKERDDNGATLLHAAARHNRLAVMQYLIESSDTSLNTLDNDGNTPLHIAVEFGCIEAMHLLLSSGASDTILNKKMDAPLHIAVRSNNCDLVAGFLDHPIDLFVEGYRKRTPLHVISEYDNIEACEVVSNSVLMQQAKQNKLRLCSQDEDKLTAIHLAARKGSHRVLDFFLKSCMQHGYPRETVLSFLDEENSTPLHAAIDGGNVEVVNVLLKYGANPTAIKEDQAPPLHLACSQGRQKMVELMVDHCGKEILQHRDQYGRPPLHYCTHAINSAQMIAYLAQNGADINSTCNAGRNALHVAAVSGNLVGTKELLSHGADPLTIDMHGFNPLHSAVANNRKEIVKLFLELPCAPQLVNTCNRSHVCPLSSALKLGLGDLVELLVEAVGNHLQVTTDEKGRSYLHLAASSGDWKALSILLKIPCCQKIINVTDEKGMTPLHVAAAGGHTHCVEVLLRHGAMIHKCNSGMTPFMVALCNGHPDCARILFEAHPFQKKWTDDNGNTALHIAAQSNNPRCITLALDLGIPATHNLSQESFFDFIIDHANFDCAMAVVNHERWQECLDCCSPHFAPPMLGLISRMPAVAQAVLDRCYTKSCLDSEHQGYWEKFHFKYLRLQSESSDPDVDESTDAIDPEHMDVTTPMIRYKLSSHSNTPSPLPQRKVDRSYLQVLQQMVCNNRVGLLTHPVVEAYLRMKWNAYGRWYYLLTSSTIILHLIFLSAFILVAPNPATAINTTDNNTFSNHSESSSGLSPAASAMRILALIFCCVNSFPMFDIALGIFKRIKLEALRFLWVWIQIWAVICTFIFLIPPKPIWEAGALAAFFIWFRIFLALQPFEIFGIYVTMFLTITRTVLQVLLMCFLLLAAFALSLYILAGKVLLFSTIGYSLFTVFGYMLGEIQYEFFIQEDSAGQFQSASVLTFMFVIVLAILLAIVMANLLIGLAVGDIENIKRNAIAEKRSVDVYLYQRIHATLPQHFLKRFDKPYNVMYPNSDISWIRKTIRTVWRTLEASGETQQAAGGPTNLAVSQDHSSELAAIKEQLENLTLLVKQLHEVQQQQRNVLPEVEAGLPE